MTVLDFIEYYDDLNKIDTRDRNRAERRQAERR